MPNELTDYEKEERELEKLRDRKPAPSRKYTERRAPRPEQRRRRMRTDDPDLKKPDLETSKKVAFLADLALRITLSAGEPEGSPESEDDFKKDIEEIEASAKRAAAKLSNYSKKVGNAFAEHIKKILLGSRYPAKAKEEVRRVLKSEVGSDQDKLLNDILTASGSQEILDIIFDAWNDDAWMGKAVIFHTIKEAVEKLRKGRNIPSYIVSAILSGVSKSKDAELLENIIKDSGKKPLKSISMAAVERLLTVAAIYRVLTPDTKKNDLNKLTTEIESDLERIYKQILDVQATQNMMNAIEGAVKEFSEISKGVGKKWEPSQGLDKLEKTVNSFYKLDEAEYPMLVEKKYTIDDFKEYLEETYKKIPEPIKKLLKGARLGSSNYQPSNEKYITRPMQSKQATYHGVTIQGHPESLAKNPEFGFQTDFRSYDKRYFGKEQYDSIVTAAQKLLEEDWLKYEWDGGSPEARFRAALDLSIYTTDNYLYQNKIDAETYEMLLNRLAGWGYDSFVETVFPKDKNKNRSASAMQREIQNILRVASKIRKIDPEAAFEIVKNMRSLVSSEAHVAQEQGQEQGQEAQEEGKTGQQFTMQGQQEQQGQQECMSQEQQGQQQQQADWEMLLRDPDGDEPIVIGPSNTGPGHTGQQQQQGQQEQQSAFPAHMSDEDIEKWAKKADPQKLKDQIKSLQKAISDKDVDAFVEGFMDLGELVKKTGSVRVSAEYFQFKSLADADKDTQEKIIQDTEQAVKAMAKDVDDMDYHEFLDEFDKLFEKLQKKTGSIVNPVSELAESLVAHLATPNGVVAATRVARQIAETPMVSLSTLVRIAYEHPETRPALLPVILAAKKKDKKKGKTSQPKKEEKEEKGKAKKPPFKAPAKKAPPAKKPPPKGTKKKASITSSDLNW